MPRVYPPQLQHRRGKGEIVIINHDGRGWWDPLSDRKGDIFTLIRLLDPGLNFGEARRRLRGFMGIVPAFPEAPAHGEHGRPTCLSPSGGRDAAVCHLDRRPGATSLISGGLPETILVSARAADAVREASRGSAGWFAHRDGAGRLTGIEMLDRRIAISRRAAARRCSAYPAVLVL